MDTNNEEMKRILGVFYGQLIGDSLGCRYEFKESSSVRNRISRDKNSSGFLPILGGGPFQMKPGQVKNRLKVYYRKMEHRHSKKKISG